MFEKAKLYQSSLNVRDENIWCRNGMELPAKKIHTLKDLHKKPHSIIGIDELHMFETAESQHIKNILKNNVEVFAAGLDKNHLGETFELVQDLLNIKNTRAIYLTSTCEICGCNNASYTQVFYKDTPVTHNLPQPIPDDGTYGYKPVCEKCFIFPQQ